MLPDLPMASRALLPVVLAVSVACLFVACADASSGPVAPGPDAAPEGAAESGAKDSGGKDAGPKSTCEITRAYFELCGNEGDLTCGTNDFDAWCTANDTGLNSEAYRRAEALCLVEENCDGKKRRACEYEHYNSETPTASQAAIVAAYCEMCEAGDVAGCTTRSTKFDPVKGLDSVGDIYVAAWEFSDAIVDEMTTKCTGAAVVDAGVDVAACAKTFGSCTADIYLARLPECPK
jgi:hypothetical protein